MDENKLPKITIIPKPVQEFRPKHEKRDLEISFSEVIDNDHPNSYKAKKRLSAFDKESGQSISTIYFNEKENSLVINESATDPKFDGNQVGLKLYNELIRIAQEEGFRKVKSDCVVQGGELAVWKKLRDHGYTINVHPLVNKKFEEFVKVYAEGRFFKEALEVPFGESCFVLVLNRENSKEEELVISDSTKETFINYFRRPVLDYYKSLTSYEEYKKGKYSSTTISNDLVSFELLLEALKAADKDFSGIINSTKTKVSKELQEAQEKEIAEEGVDIMKYFDPSEGVFSVFASQEEKESVVVYLKNELAALNEISAFIR